jgi:RNA recognition motif-containing protein
MSASASPASQPEQSAPESSKEPKAGTKLFVTNMNPLLTEQQVSHTLNDLFGKVATVMSIDSKRSYNN